MKGTTMEELRERLTYGGEAEFTYEKTSYIIQINGDDSNTHVYLTMWEIEPNAKLLSEIELPNDGFVEDKYIDFILNEKCIEGKSFMEVEKDITVDCYF